LDCASPLALWQAGLSRRNQMKADELKFPKNSRLGSEMGVFTDQFKI